METPERGSVWWTDLPALGRKPVVVISTNRLNGVLQEVVAARITSVARERVMPTYVELEPGEVEGLPERSFVLLHSLFTVRAGALASPAGDVPEARMTDIEAALAYVLHLRLA